MTRKIFSKLMLGFACIGVLVGSAVLVTNQSLLALCQRGCWLNSFLFAVFGDQGGKIVYAMIWYLAAGVIAFFSWRLGRKS